MASHYEVLAKCPTTGQTVHTGHKMKQPEFEEDEKPCGGYNCTSCGNAHFWSYDDEGIQIGLVAE